MTKFIKTITKREADGPALFWLFDQNNAGGYYEDELPVFLFIEARSPREANMRAETLGVNFRDINDFSGERWSSKDQWDEGMKTPTVYHDELEHYINTTDYLPRHPYIAAVVRLDGTVTEYWTP